MVAQVCTNPSTQWLRRKITSSSKLACTTYRDPISKQNNTTKVLSRKKYDQIEICCQYLAAVWRGARGGWGWYRGPSSLPKY